MLHTKSTPIKWFSLIIVALFCGVLWRLELEHHGWRGLIWIRYFHYAVPIGFTVFLTWCNGVVKVPFKKRLLLNVISIFYGISMYILLEYALRIFFARGLPRWDMETDVLYRMLHLLVIPLLPIGMYVILRLFQFKLSLKKSFLTVFIFIAFTLISPYMLELVNHKGGHDLIHSVKSGLIIPLWIIALGSLLINSND